MSLGACSRRWQVEATRDGRLRGKDRESALRHQATCADCGRELRLLTALAAQIARLPEPSRDPLTARRTRQRLFAAFNQSVVDPAPTQRSLGPVAFALGIALIAALGWLTVDRHLALSSSPDDVQSIVDVDDRAGAHWSEYVQHAIDRITLKEGVLSFTVHPHPGRRVLIALPDGELEDLGTVFQVRVADHHTQFIAVSEGRVAVRLLGRPEFSLAAGHTWSADAAEASVRAPVAGSAAPPVPTISSTAPGTPLGSPSVPAASVARAHVSAPLDRARGSASVQAPTKRDSAVANAPSAQAEDDAYLHIVELLKRDLVNQARREAKDYLLRFPSGFRRVEIVDIATRSDDAGVEANGH